MVDLGIHHIPAGEDDRPVITKKIITGMLFALSLFLCLSVGCGQKPDDAEPAASSPSKTNSDAGKSHAGRIVAVGNSLTAGLGVDERQAYPSVLEKRLLAEGYPFTVINAGVSGETSSGTLSRIEWIISSLKPDMVILVTGANDGLRGISPNLLYDNLDRLVRILKKNRIRIVLGGMKMLTNLGPDYVANFERVYPEIASKHQVTLIPFFLEGVAGQKNLNQADGIHPNAAGYARLVEHIYPYIVQTIGEKPPK